MKYLLKYGSKKYILIIHKQINKKIHITYIIKIKISYTGIRARKLVCETLIFNNLSAYLLYLLIIDLISIMHVMQNLYCFQKHDDVLKAWQKILYYSHILYIKNYLLRLLKTKFHTPDSGNLFWNCQVIIKECQAHLLSYHALLYFNMSLHTIIR